MKTEESIKQMFDNLKNLIPIPKYQAERRLDLFFGLYLKDILKNTKTEVFGKDTEVFGDKDVLHIIPEFPLQIDKDTKEEANKDDNNKKVRINDSNNIDYVVFNETQKRIYAIKLKTDCNSINNRTQIKYYKRFKNEITAKELIEFAKKERDFLNWFIDLPYKHKIFVTGNHDLCLWEADGIEDLPDNVNFLQDRGCVIEGVGFFGLAYNHNETLIPDGIDILVTHEPPVMIRDLTFGEHWGNAPLRNRVFEVRPKYHLFGHAHDCFGKEAHNDVVFSNGAVLDDYYNVRRQMHILTI